MPITPKTPMSDIEQFLAERIAAMERTIVYRMQIIGEQVLNQARSAGNYQDQTGNLRSSVGYVIVRDGIIIKTSDFATVKDGAAGSKEGESFARSLAERFNKGIVLIVVAGMNYAYYVKKLGYDVIDSSELLADKLVPQMLKQLGLIIKR